MNDFQYFILFSIGLVIMISIIFALKLRKTLHHTQGMMITMFLSTNIGLTIGVLFGSFFQGNLYVSTLISMAVGSVAGSVCGFAFGLMGSLEGVMTGLMSSMMGAMLGEMMTKSQSGSLIKILLTLTICSLFLFFILHPRSDDMIIKSKKWFLKPFITFVLIISYLIIGMQFYDTKDSTTHHHIHSLLNIKD